MQISEHEVWLPLRLMGSSGYSSLCCMCVLGHISWELKIQKGVLSHRVLRMLNSCLFFSVVCWIATCRLSGDSLLSYGQWENSWWWSLPHRIGPDFVVLHDRAPKQYMRKEEKKIQMFPMTWEVPVKCLCVIWVVRDVTEVVGLGWFHLVFVVAVLNDPP